MFNPFTDRSIKPSDYLPCLRESNSRTLSLHDQVKQLHLTTVLSTQQAIIKVAPQNDLSSSEIKIKQISDKSTISISKLFVLSCNSIGTNLQYEESQTLKRRGGGLALIHNVGLREWGWDPLCQRCASSRQMRRTWWAWPRGRGRVESRCETAKYPQRLSRDVERKDPNVGETKLDFSR